VCVTAAQYGDGVVVGLNQYSHDASIAVVDAVSGELLFAAAKERLTRRKHDGGSTGELVLHAMESLGFDEDDVRLVVANNHHFRVLPFERRLKFAAGAGYVPQEYLQDPLAKANVRKMEISHHLAHTWSVLPYCPFSEGLIVVMDGMGEHIREFSTADDLYVVDDSYDKHSCFTEFPRNKRPFSGYREAESAFYFRGAEIQRVFKRWTPENSPPELYNHGFENMESLGALYSRVSTHIFGDWNACGKVMGLAPYYKHLSEREGERDMSSLLHGSLHNGTLRVNFEYLDTLPKVDAWSEGGNFLFYAQLAHAVQTQVEEQVLVFLKDLQKRTGAKNLCLVGGVALNSTINGRVVRESGFEKVYIPPYPGDEGIAIGCAAFGALGTVQRSSAEPPQPVQFQPPVSIPGPYLGRQYTEEDVRDACCDEDVAPFLEGIFRVGDEFSVDDIADVLSNDGIIGWFHGRSEHGPRALGNRSLLADPRRASTRDRLNIEVKGRETFRPLAPAVLEEHADKFFETHGRHSLSPYMSMTANVREGVRGVIPAVTHIDGTARLQTVSKRDAGRMYEIIEAFGKKTGVPVLLNTSFNVAGEPIVESPRDALMTFLDSPIDVLVIEGLVVLKKDRLGYVDTKWPVQLIREPLDVTAEGRNTVARFDHLRLSFDDREVVLTNPVEAEVMQTLMDSDGESSVEALASAIEDQDEEVYHAVLALYERRLVDLVRGREAREDREHVKNNFMARFASVS